MQHRRDLAPPAPDKTHSSGAGGGHTLRYAELELDRAGHVARIGGREIELTPIEFRLLELFMFNPEQVLPPKLIYDRVWGYDFGLAGNTLRVYIGYVRRKLERDGQRRLIQTVYGRGYVLREF